ncbi:MAG: phosphate/phosphite/phosphonate ABC transporter substrate-binding protein [Candidatus Methanoperedens sp.]|nr:phosphate/phosphite/phosphonate ABC transporter substrate-binding protein [Candidatus Methanoperedens sp.]
MNNRYLIIFILLILFSGCVEKPEKKINLSMVQEPDIREGDPAVKVAIGPVISPKESYIYYEEMIRYISIKINGPVKIIQRHTYQEINELIRNKEIEFAFICSGPYVEGNSDFGMKLLVVPQMYGRTTYNSYIIVPKNSSYNNFSQLRGKRFAFTDPLSSSGTLYPEYLLALINETPDSFFGKDENGKNNSFFTYSHDYSIIAVAEGLADGAAVNSLVYEYMKKTKPEIISKTQIIETSPAFANPPIVVPKEIDPFLEQRLKDIFINMEKDDKGREILSNIMIDKFVTINDSAYDTIREMRGRVK